MSHIVYFLHRNLLHSCLGFLTFIVYFVSLPSVFVIYLKIANTSLYNMIMQCLLFSIWQRRKHFAKIDFLCFFSFLKLLVYFLLRKCRYVGNIHTQVTEPLLQEVFSSTGPVEGCKLIRKEKVLCHSCIPVFLFQYIILLWKGARGWIVCVLSCWFTRNEVDVYVSLKCSLPMDSFITTIADQLDLPYFLLMEGTCKNSSWWFSIIFLLDFALVS